jgi:mRNA-degrading endonuclease toxin of MazEF toxin-antitoxin module
MTLRGTTGPAYDDVLAGVVELLEQSRRLAARTVNSVMTATYWDIGRRIVEQEQHGEARAGYGKELLSNLSADLTLRFGRGFSRRNLNDMRAFFLAHPVDLIWQTLSAKSPNEPIGAPGSRTFQTLSGTSASPGVALPDVARAFPLPWSHYVLLLSVKDEAARRFYETEALRGGWSVRQLTRQIDSMFYERTAVVLQNDVGNRAAATTIVAAVTTTIRPFPVTVVVEPGEGGLDRRSMVNLAQIVTIDQDRLLRHLGTLSAARMLDVDVAVRVSLTLS